MTLATLPCTRVQDPEGSLLLGLSEQNRGGPAATCGSALPALCAQRHEGGRALAASGATQGPPPSAFSLWQACIGRRSQSIAAWVLLQLCSLAPKQQNTDCFPTSQQLKKG